ncbi:hypothetical protein WSM22_28260 [Cytophagales bacterium WSM2-2]|nr:hypothetical protein WSM22_28260 [Cytophagales bacterium WSM2-2]
MWALWRSELKNKRFIIHLIIALLGLTAFALVLPHFFIKILLPKPGVPLHDPILNFFTPKDWSIEIFVLLYFCTVLSLTSNLAKPRVVLLGFQTYVIVNFLRITSLYLFTLEAPEGIIPLSDPFLTVFAYGQPVYVKDLFFSGHVSTLCVLFFIEERKKLKLLILASALAVSVLLAWQRVHYTLDMVAAPVITWVVFRFFRWLDSWLVYKEITT